MKPSINTLVLLVLAAGPLLAQDTSPSRSPSISRPSGAARPNISRPNTGGRPNYSNRPSPNDLGNFLDLPGTSRPNIGDRTNIVVNRQNNIHAMRNRWTNVEQRPFDRNWWSGGNYRNNASWRWQRNWSRYPNNWCWRPCTWAAFGGWFAWSWARPYSYDYGSTVVYRDNYVYVNDQQYATTEAYYQQAETIAQSVPQDVEADKVEWMPLGVFAIAEENATDSGLLVQLAVSKEGIIAGTFYNDITKSNRPLEGMVDQKSQRAVWKFADDKNPEVAMETGVYNLTQDEATAMVHFGADKMQTWLMVRLPDPEKQQ